MKKIHSTIKALAALLMAGAAFAACSSDDIAAEQSLNTPATYTLTVNAVKGSSSSTRALSLSNDGNTINATWGEGEQVIVYNSSSEEIGTLTPATTGTASAQLTGNITGTMPSVNEELTLKFLSDSYTSQTGTLDYISSNCDFATAVVTVTAVDETAKTITTDDASFTNQQAIIKLTLKDKSTDNAISPSALTITDGTSTVSLTDIPEATYTANGAGVLYVAFPAAGEGKTIVLTSGNYGYAKSNVVFENGNYYAITVKARTYPIDVASVTSDYVGSVITTDGYVYATVAAATAAEKTPVAMITYMGDSGFLALALSDESSAMNWSDANDACSNKNTSTSVSGCSWTLATKEEWDNMTSTAGSGEALINSFSSVGGTAMGSDRYYWSSTESANQSRMCWNRGSWYDGPTGNTNYVRACLTYGSIYKLLSEATSADYGKVVCAAGHLHDAKTTVPSGCTAVGILGQVTGTGHGLILALQDATNQTWNTINGWTSVSTYAGTTLKLLPDDTARGSNLTSYTTLGETIVSNWAVAQKSDYEAIFTNLGSDNGFNSAVNEYITGAGGAEMGNHYFWSATKSDDTEHDYAWAFLSGNWIDFGKDNSFYVRPVLGFAPAAGHALSASAVGEIVGSDGLAYAVANKDNLPSGVTAVAMVAYVGTESDCTHGLAIALSDESSTEFWSGAVSACSSKAPTVTGGTWRLPSVSDWQYMLIGCGSSGTLSMKSYMDNSGLVSKLSTAGSTLTVDRYWTATEVTGLNNYAYCFYPDPENGATVEGNEESTSRHVFRACLAF